MYPIGENTAKRSKDLAWRLGSGGSVAIRYINGAYRIPPYEKARHDNVISIYGEKFGRMPSLKRWGTFLALKFGSHMVQWKGNFGKCKHCEEMFALSAEFNGPKTSYKLRMNIKNKLSETDVCTFWYHGGEFTIEYYANVALPFCKKFEAFK